MMIYFVNVLSPLGINFIIYLWKSYQIYWASLDNIKLVNINKMRYKLPRRLNNALSTWFPIKRHISAYLWNLKTLRDLYVAVAEVDLIAMNFPSIFLLRTNSVRKHSFEKKKRKSTKEIFSPCHKKLIMQKYVQIKIISRRNFNFARVKTNERRERKRH